MAKSTASRSQPHLVRQSLASDLAKALLEWYDATRRDLPWRRTSDPYAILVSEFMLQQTQVATVVPYFERFLREFPDVHTLARASEQDVLRQWAGLGYYSRARNLHATAVRIVEDYGGRVPDSFADLLFLPGVGRYVAGAVASIAHGVVVGAVDANVARVVCRLFALDLSPTAPRARQELEERARRLVSRERPGDFNQAMMELGARVCSAAAPRCVECPLRSLCMAAEEGAPENYPQKPKRTAPVAVEEACAVVRRSSRCFIVRRSASGGRYRNMWEFPCVELEPRSNAARALSKHLREAYGLRAQIGEEWAEIRHQVTHHKIRKRVFLCETLDGADESRLDEEEARWATLDEIAALPLGAPHKRILALLAERSEMWSE